MFALHLIVRLLYRITQENKSEFSALIVAKFLRAFAK